MGPMGKVLLTGISDLDLQLRHNMPLLLSCTAKFGAKQLTAVEQDALELVFRVEARLLVHHPGALNARKRATSL